MHEFEKVLRERVAQYSEALRLARESGDSEAADQASDALRDLLLVASAHGVDVRTALDGEC